MDATGAQQELEEARAAAGERLIAKLPAQTHLYGLAERLTVAGWVCAITGTYSAAQAVVAAAVGARWVIPYVDCSERLRPGSRIVLDIATALRAVNSDTGIVAASIKSSEQAVQAFLDGATVVSAPIDVLRQLPHDPCTDQAVDEFLAAVESPRG